ncbi:MAG: regulator of sirC expression with transglutaminase-like and TPR domain, partial [Bacteroidia bacterium]
LGIVYALIAQRLNIPVYGVNLPQHFVLGYKNIEGLEILKSFNDESSLTNDDNNEVMFYINPFTEGLILNGESIRSFLKQLKVESKPEYFNICTNLDIVKRVLRNMLFSYEKVEQHDKSEIVQKLLASI